MQILEKETESPIQAVVLPDLTESSFPICWRFTNPDAKRGETLLGGVSQVSPSPGQATSQVQDRRPLTASPQAFPMSGQMASGKR